MTAQSLVGRLLAAGAILWREGPELCLRAPPGAVTPELRAEILAAKPHLLDLLGDRKLAPASFAQARMYVLHRLLPDPAAYNVAAALWLRGALDHAALARALDDLVARHESLRTLFVLLDGQVAQAVLPPRPAPLRHVDLRGHPPADRGGEARRLAAAAARAAFDLEAAPPLAFDLLRLSADEHVLVCVVHHSLADGASVAVLERELAALYAAHAAGAPPDLPPPDTTPADLAAAQRGHTAAEEVARQVGYWQRELAGLPPLLLPTDRSRPAAPSSAGAVHRFALPPALSERLRELARREAATPFMLLLAALQALLWRYTAQAEFAVGAPVAGRDDPALAGTVGMLVNTVALRGRPGDNPTFRELLRRARETTLAAQAHVDAPFERIIQALDLPPEVDRLQPVVPVMLALQGPAPRRFTLPGLDVDVEELSTGTARLDLALSLDDTAAGIAGFAEYRLDLFDAATIERLVDHYAVLLAGALDDPDRRIGDLPLLTAEERSRLLGEWAGAARPEPAGTLDRLFAEQAARTPDAVALADGRRQLTYRELDRRANALAHRLDALGVRDEAAVAVVMESSVELVVAALAIWKAGGVYVPLDPEHPAARLAHALADTGARAVLTDRRSAARLPPADAAVGLVDAAVGETDEPPCRDVRPANLAYVIYTSGSTGQPKGVAVPHVGPANLAGCMASDLAIGPGDRLLQCCAPTFDISIMDVVGALLNGATLHVASRDELVPGPPLARLLRDRAITVLTATPTQMAATDSSGLPDLRLLILGGEAVTPELARRWTGGRTVLNGYGPTECSVATTLSDPLAADACPIGRPISNVRVYVLDPRGQPVPIGVAGELFVGGVGLARGYFGRPGLTAERFVPDPFGPAPGGRLYATGDMVRWQPDGQIEFLGRADGQVKLRGVRVELGELEAALAAHPSVGAAAALVRRDGAAGDQLVAYVTPRNGGLPDPAELRRSLVERLPRAMLPAAIVPLASLPLTAHGKLDRAALPPPTVPTPARPGPDDAPASDLERALLDAWREQLALPAIGRHDDFFELGGHSLHAVGLVDAIRRRTGRLVPLADLFEARTIAALAARMDDAPPQRPLPPVIPSAAKDPPPRPLSLWERLTQDAERGRPGPLSLWRVPACGWGQRRPGARGMRASFPPRPSRPHPLDGAEALPPPARVNDVPGTPAVPPSGVVALRATGTRPPLFCVGPMTGVVFVYADLARHLGDDQPVFGLHPPGIDGRARPARTVEAQAAAMAAALALAHPTGPVNLLGWSYGGLVAFELAQQLVREGREVGQLALLDAPAPAAPRLDRAVASVATVLAAAWPYLRAYGRLRRLAARAIARATAADHPTVQLDAPALRPMLDLFMASAGAARRYRARPYPGALTLLRTGDPAAWGHDRTLGWLTLASAGVEVVPIPGGHMTLLRRPHVDTLAAELRARL